MKALLSVREAAVMAGKSRKACLRWLKARRSIEPDVLTKEPGELQWVVQTAALRRLLGLTDWSLQSQVDTMQRQVNRIEARLDRIEVKHVPA